MSSIEVISENLHFDVILSAVDLVFGGRMEADVIHLPVDLMVLITSQWLSCVEAAAIGKGTHLVDPVLKAVCGDLDILWGIWEE